MIDRFTDQARRALALAEEEARALGHDHVGTEHLLLGVMAETSGIAAKTLRKLGVTLPGLRDGVTRVAGRGEEPVAGEIPFTPEAKELLERSPGEALGLGDSGVRTEHILLGLLREEESAAARALHELDVERDELVGELMAMVSAVGYGRSPRRRRPAWQFDVVHSHEVTAEQLNEYGRLGWDVVSVAGQPGAFTVVLRRPA